MLRQLGCVASLRPAGRATSYIFFLNLLFCELALRPMVGASLRAGSVERPLPSQCVRLPLSSGLRTCIKPMEPSRSQCPGQPAPASASFGPCHILQNPIQIPPPASSSLLIQLNDLRPAPTPALCSFHHLAHLFTINHIVRLRIVLQSFPLT